MARVRVVHGIDDLEGDMVSIAKRARPDMVKTVREGLKVGNSIARDNAKRSGGPHGKRFYKRYSWEMHGVVAFGGTAGISGEYGPEGIPKSEFVGAGYRNNGPNLDLPNSADQIAPAFYGEVKRLPEKWFW